MGRGRGLDDLAVVVARAAPDEDALPPHPAAASAPVNIAPRMPAAARIARASLGECPYATLNPG
jgi:hypothetical protein